MLHLFIAALLAAGPGFDFELVPTNPLEPFVSEAYLGSAMLNPGILVIPGEGIELGQTFWLSDSRLSMLNLKWKTYGVSLLYVDFGSFEYQESSPNDDGGPSFRPYALNFSLKKGFRIDQELSIGFGLNYFYNKILYDEASNITLDAGMFYRPQKLTFASFGLSVRHFGLKAGFRKIDYKMPTEVRFSGSGAVKKFRFGYEYRKIVTYSENKSLFSGLGVEHLFKAKFDPVDNLRLMAVYAVGREVDPLVFGLSYGFKGFTLSYAYRLTSLGFDDVHHLGLTYSFRP